LIREFGWTNPVLVDGANGVRGTWEAAGARKLGLSTVRIIELAALYERLRN
jgi:hypothetical protein